MHRICKQQSNLTIESASNFLFDPAKHRVFGQNVCDSYSISRVHIYHEIHVLSFYVSIWRMQPFFDKSEAEKDSAGFLLEYPKDALKSMFIRRMT